MTKGRGSDLGFRTGKQGDGGAGPDIGVPIRRVQSQGEPTIDDMPLFYHNPDPRLEGLVKMITSQKYEIILGVQTITFKSAAGEIVISTAWGDLHMGYTSPYPDKERQLLLFAGCFPPGQIVMLQPEEEEHEDEPIRTVHAVAEGASIPQVHEDAEDE